MRRLPSRRQRTGTACGGGQRAFTLVEMLVVITIIGVLAALLIPTVGSVMRTGRLTAVATELSNLSGAIEAYRLDHNDYPPDFSNAQAVRDHMRAAWPRYPAPHFTDWVPAAGFPNPQNLDPAEALVFWLAGTSSNPRDPLFARQTIFVYPAGAPVAMGSNDPKTYFEFKTDQLTDVDQDGWPEYASDHAQGVPYVYFDGRIQNDRHPDTGVQMSRPGVSVYAWASYPLQNRPVFTGRDLPIPAPVSGVSVVRPYRSNMLLSAAETATWPRPPTPASQINNTTWIDAGKFQLIAPGLDQSYGFDFTADNGALLYRKFPNPDFRHDDEQDNIASFSENRTFEDSVTQ